MPVRRNFHCDVCRQVNPEDWPCLLDNGPRHCVKTGLASLKLTEHYRQRLKSILVQYPCRGRCYEKFIINIC